MKKISRLFIILLLINIPLLNAQTFNRGKDRWAIKTSAITNTTAKKVPLESLLALKHPITSRKEAPQDKLISKKVGGRKEGDIITTYGYIHLIATENSSKDHTDGDYHIQVRTSKTWGDSCFIVEIPRPEFIDDPVLVEKCKVVRQFVKERLLKGKEPGTTGNIMKHDVYVTMIGQLFLDSWHLKGELRGKKGIMKTPMKSYTCWEIHPVTEMKFAPKPK